MQISEIGEVAGAVWRFLRENGEATLAALERGVDAPRAQVHMAVGWLGREGKINSRPEGRSTVFGLVGE